MACPCYKSRIVCFTRAKISLRKLISRSLLVLLQRACTNLLKTTWSLILRFHALPSYDDFEFLPILFHLTKATVSFARSNKSIYPRKDRIFNFSFEKNRDNDTMQQFTRSIKRLLNLNHLSR